METIPTPRQFKETMENLAMIEDQERRHILMDGYMCEVLIAFGYAEGVEVFGTTPLWYA